MKGEGLEYIETYEYEQQINLKKKSMYI